MNRDDMIMRGPVWRLWLGMSLPTIFVMLVIVAYNMADVYFIGRVGDAAQVAAISLAGPAYGLIQGLGTLLGSGGCTAAALASGRGRRVELAAVTSFCLYGSLAVGTALGIAGAVYATEVGQLLGARGAVQPYAAEYLRILAMGAPAILTTGVLANMARADGSMKDAMLGNGLGTVLNIVLDPLLIEVLGLGVRGAALATVLGNLIGGAVLLTRLARRPGNSFDPRVLRGNARVCGRVLALGLPLALSVLLGSCAGALGNGLLSGYGTVAVAANGVASKAGMLVSMVAMGVCMGIQPAISIACGRGDAKRACRIARNTGLMAFALSAALTLACAVGRAGFVGAFVREPEVVQLGVVMLSVSLIVCPLSGIYQMCTAFLQATGDASGATLLSVLRQGIVFVPCLYITNMLGGLYGLMYAGVIADVAALALALMFVYRQGRRLHGAGMPTPAAL